MVSASDTITVRGRETNVTSSTLKSLFSYFFCFPFFIWRSLRGCDYVVVDEHWKKDLDWETVLTMMVCVCWLVSIVLKWKTLISLLFGEECGQSAGKSWLAKSAERWREGDGAVWWGPLMLDDMVWYREFILYRAIEPLRGLNHATTSIGCKN